jgi:hypothetical protein
VSEQAARRPATSAFLTEAERSEASLLGVGRGLGDFSSLVRGVSGALLPESYVPPAKPADRVDHCLGIDNLPLT